MDASILVVAAPSIRSNLHASGAELQMIVAMYTLTFGALVVIGARLGDILGRRRAFSRASRYVQGMAAALMTPQVLSIIQVQFEGERRAHAIGAHSMILAVGVAAGQIVGGLLVTAHLLGAAWRPTLLLNAAIGAPLLLVARRVLPPMAPEAEQRLDFVGGGLLAAAMLALVVPLSFGRESGWPAWSWLCLEAFALAAFSFVVHERRVQRRGRDPPFELGLLQTPRITAAVVAVLLIMSCYAGFLVSLTAREALPNPSWCRSSAAIRSGSGCRPPTPPSRSR
jgi:MFS family permease